MTFKATDSPMWSDLLKVMDLYLHGRVSRFVMAKKLDLSLVFGFMTNPWLILFLTYLSYVSKKRLRYMM
jgi:hypothetical protein